MNLQNDPFDPNVDVWNECGERGRGDEASPTSVADFVVSPKEQESQAFLARRSFDSNDPQSVAHRAIEKRLFSEE